MQITINGDAREWPKAEMTYDELVAFAGMKGNPSATYLGPRNGDSRREGIMSPGKTITIEDGMRFSVHHTGNA